MARTTSSAPRPPWADVLASIEDGIIVLDASGRIADVNPAAEQLLGVSAAVALGSDLDTLCPNAPWIAKMAHGALGDSATQHRGEGAFRGRGRDVPLRVGCAPVVDAGGAARGAVVVLHDLTLQRTLDMTTRRAERLDALGTVARGLAHEIRNPLGGIKGAAQLIRGAVDDPELHHCTDIIVREVERLDGLVEQLRELSTPPRLQLGPVNIYRVLNDVIALERQGPRWGTVRLRTVFDPSLPAVLGDRAQLTQVFLNLVKNALEALAGTGELALSTSIEIRYRVRRGGARGRFLSVLIEDDGPGVAEADQSQLFSPFFSTKPRGTGLGLAVCHRIVSEHGGTITHEGRAPRGAAFRVTLPATEDDGAAATR